MKKKESPVTPEDIKWLREHVFGMSLASFGNLWDVSSPAVHRWESGERKPAGHIGLLVHGAIKIAQRMVLKENGDPTEAAQKILKLIQDEPIKLFRAAGHAGPVKPFFGKGSGKEKKSTRAEQVQQRRAAELRDLLMRNSLCLTERERRAVFDLAPRLLSWMVDSLWVIIGRGRSLKRDELLERLEQLATDVEETAVEVSEFQGQPLRSSDRQFVPEEAGLGLGQSRATDPHVSNQANGSEATKDEL